MSTIDIIRAWKDADYRSSLSDIELAAIPQHPAGQIDLRDAELKVVVEGLSPSTSLCPWTESFSYCPPCKLD